MKKLKQVFTWANLKETSEKVISKPILASLLVLILASAIVIIITITQYGYSYEFLKNVLVEAHGMLFDILIIGTFIFALHKLGEKRLEKKHNILRWQEEIDDFRGWDEKEATYRIVGNIKRLNKMGVTNINLKNCYLENAKLNGVRLKDANLSGANLTKANLARADLIEANLTKSILRYANLHDADLSDANLSGANLEGADLKGAIMLNCKLCEVYGRWQEELEGTNLKNADLFLASLEGADLRGADLRRAKNILIDQIGRTKSLYNAKLDPELKEQIKEKSPHLLEHSEEV